MTNVSLRDNGRVSVVVPSFGRPDLLVRCAASVARSLPRPPGGIELVVVCAGYSDEILQQLHGVVNKSAIDLRIVELSTAEPTSVTRNIGVWASTGATVFFVDDDNELSMSCVQEMWRALNEWDDSCVVAPVMYWGDAPDQIWCAGLTRTKALLRTKWRRSIPNPAPERLPSVDFPNAFAVRARDFLIVGGFDGRLFPQCYEEADLIARLKSVTGQGAFCCVSGSTWHHIGSEPHRRFHLTSPLSAFRLAQHRKIFIARYARWPQRLIEICIGRWLYLAAYLLAAQSAPKKYRTAIRSAYIRGVLKRTPR